LENLFSGTGYIQLIGMIAGILTSMSLMPQLIKTFKTKTAEEISLVMLFTLMLGIALWIYYGILRKDLPIIITNAFSFLLNVTLIGLRLKYKK
jgi:MtN3 and saliva related transmembrane protein